MNNICTIAELKNKTSEELVQLSSDIRDFLIKNISKTGGHIGANLGLVELMIALHYVFDSPNDKIIIDTGHQGYVHKLLTGREKIFPTLNQFLGMNRFLTREESEHDIIDATHAGTSLSTAAGFAEAIKLNKSKNHVIALIGDGSLVEGLAFEGLNYLAKGDLPVIIIINDNEMAIAPNVGGIRNLTQGVNWKEKSKSFFEGLGFSYISIENGHDVQLLINTFQETKNKSGPTIIHIKTEKGKGLSFAKDHPYKMHFSMPFDPKTGLGASPTISGKTPSTMASETLHEILATDPDVIVLTPATPYASSLDQCLNDFPTRVIDVGMAEQHAVSMACGLALQGKKPIVCFQTTFMQRAFDQLLHDVCYMNLPVTILGVRSGFAGYDGPTHHGLYDIPYLRSFPNMQITYPVNGYDVQKTIKERMNSPQGPMVILHPYEQISEPEPDIGNMEQDLSLIDEGTDGIIICLGNTLENSHNVRNLLLTKHELDFGIVCIKTIKPLPTERLLDISNSKKIIVIEESALPGGLGSLICETFSDNNMTNSILRIGVNDKFVPGGNKDECSDFCKLSPDSIITKIFKHWPDLIKKDIEKQF